MSEGFLLDEHLPLWWRKAIGQRYAELTVWRVGDPDTVPLGTSDKELLRWCEAHEFYLLTNNRSTMPKHLAEHVAEGRHVAGIFQVDADMRIEELTEQLSLIVGASFESEFQDQITFLPIT